MAVSALPHSSKDPNQLLPDQYIFDIFLNASASGVMYNNTDIILPLDPPNTLQRLFKSFTAQYPLPKNFPFSPVVRHTKIKKSTKGSFLVSTIAHTIYLTTTCVVVALIAPQVYLLQHDSKKGISQLQNFLLPLPGGSPRSICAMDKGWMR